jgi:hypothetical protein
MKRFMTKKVLVLLAVAGAAVALSVGAFAYFTAGGSGSGSASVGTSANFNITATSPAAVYPGTSSPFMITVSNPGSGHQYVDTVSLASVDPVAGCDVSVFTMAPVVFQEDLAPGASDTKPASLAMANLASSQDGCKSKSLSLNFSSN